MTEVADKNTSKSDKNDEVYSITEGLSWDKFINYKPDKNKDQQFEAPRGGGTRRHNSIDYGSGANITLNTPIRSVMNGKVTLIKEYWKPNKKEDKGKYDSGLVFEGTDANGKKVKLTYGHLSTESMKKLFGTSELKNGQSIDVKAGQVLGNVSSNSKDGRNEYHVHLGKLYVDGKLTNPLNYFKTLTPYQQKSSSNSTDNTVQNNSSNESVTKESAVSQLDKSTSTSNTTSTNGSEIATASKTLADLADRLKSGKPIQQTNNDLETLVMLASRLKNSQGQGLGKSTANKNPNNSAQTTVDSTEKVVPKAQSAGRAR
jgi:hypothetical protein